MQSETQSTSAPKWMFWAGWVMSILPVLMLLMSGVMKLAKPQPLLDSFKTLGWDEDLALVLAIIELSCAAIYLIPQTSVLGAILVTGYLGGAIATHLRIHDPFVPAILVPFVLGVLIWGGLYLRCGRVRALIPLRS